MIKKQTMNFRNRPWKNNSTRMPNGIISRIVQLNLKKEKTREALETPEIITTIADSKPNCELLP